jgi:hypothetical protein
LDIDQILVQTGALWANFLPKLYFGRACGRTRFSQNEPICAYFRQGMHTGRRRAELRRVTTTTTTIPNPSLARRWELTPSSLPARRPLRPRQQLPRMAGGTASAATLTRGWGGTRRFPLFCKELRIYSSSVRLAVSFRRWCAACRTVAQTRHR